MVPLNGPEGELGTTYGLRHSNALLLVFNDFAVTNDYRINQPWLDAFLATNSAPDMSLGSGTCRPFAFSILIAWTIIPPNGIDFGILSATRIAESTCAGTIISMTTAESTTVTVTRKMTMLHQFIVGTGGAPLYSDYFYSGDDGDWFPRGFFMSNNMDSRCECGP